jgi:hypothetical protein
MKVRFAVMVCLAAGGLVLGCKHPPGTPPPTSGTGIPVDTSITGGNDTSLCFERDVLPIFVSGCSRPGCHDAASHQEGYVLTSYANIVSRGLVAGNANASEIYEVLVEDKPDKRMPQPPNPPLSVEQIAIIKRWIDEGAKNGTNCGTKCNDSVYSYTGAIMPLTKTYCNGCHNSASPSGGVILDSYAGVKIVADNGKLLGAVKRLAGYSPMPQGGSMLSACNITQIEKWVQAGAPNN